MSKWRNVLFGVLIATFVVGAPLAYLSYRRQHVRNFLVVREGVLYRSGQLSQAGLETMIRDHGIKTVVTLRDAPVDNALPPDHAEEEYCKQNEIRYFRLPQRAWESEDGEVPNEVNVRRFVEIMNDQQNYPVLVHCLAGKHRTGSMCAIYRMEFESWSNEQAIEEMRRNGWANIDEHPDVLGYLGRYRPTWLGK